MRTRNRRYGDSQPINGVIVNGAENIDSQECAGRNMRKSPKTKKPPIKALTIRQPFPELILR